jgi:arylsulfatase A-like enzyme
MRRALRTHGGSKVELTRVLQQQRVLPDIVLIVIDTWRGDHLGVVSPGLVETPNLDALAAEGVWYSAAFAHIPITGPSHASLFTGRLPSDAGVVNNGSRRIRSGVPTLAEILRAQGYQGHGTTSLTPINPRWGFGAGFATYRSETGPAGMLSSREVLDQCIQDFTAEHLRPAFDFVHFCDPHEPYDAHGLAGHRARVRFNGELVAEIPTSDYTPTKVAVQLNAGRNRIDIDSEQEYRVRRLAVTRPDRAPKFNEPIAPFRYEMSSLYTLDVDKPGPAHLTLCLDDQDGTFAEVNERYAREVVAVDSAVGAVLDAVRGRGRWDETLVIVTSDHGEELGYLDRLGHVELLYDPYVHVPLIIKPPASWGWSPGERRDDLVALSDLPVAILAALEIDGDLGMTGRDVFGDPRSPVETILMETHAPQAKRTRFAVRDATTKMIWTVQGDKWEYFDLEADPRESNNLYDADDPTIRARRADLELQVQALLGTSEGHGAAEVLDEETAEILRSLGYVN